MLRQELRSSTVITIAHRLEAVEGADFMIRLDAGRVLESGPARGDGKGDDGDIDDRAKAGTQEEESSGQDK